ncbi:hypothetical protein M011DRAFT_476236 [Sporormia fimetaria CBS 119925]|uniref:Histone deacetylase complex subunit SAP30 Sin3 binding domain-containing protein n=1 Tax=Sporormia fimetaria CBS 119925 TaxID=1340428 RepID=A0A6A6VE77_9PLEO|nr:hypothetical protein M011DRAFT_476236 [Sporormia fimetaria CBS 119925]
MPPAKRVVHDDTTGSKEKQTAGHGGARGRRTGGATVTNGSNLKEVMYSNADNTSSHSGQTEQNASGIQWSSQDRELLHGYRRTYGLNTPSCFKNPLSHAVLGQGIGRYSPTMARPKSKRRVTKDHLALAVRKNFNANGVHEQDVLVDLLYRVKNQDKGFRLRFAPRK